MGKWLVATYSVGQVLLLRSVAALVVLISDHATGRGSVRASAATRTACGSGRSFHPRSGSFYWAVTYLPLADVMTYYLAGPIYVAAFAVFLLGEQLDRPRVCDDRRRLRRRPDRAQALARHTDACPHSSRSRAAIFYALLMITTRKLRDTPDTTLVLGQILGALLFGAIAAPFAWVSPSPLDLPLLSLLGIVSMAGHACVNRSLKLAPASVVAPYQYTLIVWAIVFGYLAFGDIVEFWTLVGAGVICAAGLILLFLERSAARQGRVARDIEKPILPEA